MTELEICYRELQKYLEEEMETNYGKGTIIGALELCKLTETAKLERLMRE